MSDQTAVERVGDLMIQLQRCRTGRETPQENLDDLEQISTLFVGIAQELDAANATLKEIAEWAGACDDNGFMPDGLRCSRQARRRLGVTE